MSRNPKTTWRRGIFAQVLPATLLLTCVLACEKRIDESPFTLSRDPQIEQYLAALDGALQFNEVEEADAAFDNARKRWLSLSDNPFAARILPMYRDRLVRAAGKIVRAKRETKGLTRIIIHRGFDPRLMERPKRRFEIGDLRARLQAAPEERRARIEELIEHYSHGGGRPQYRRYLSRLAAYRNHIEKVFRAHGLPRELACVAMIESAVDPTRVSVAGAAGLWQFIPGTARRYGLVVTEAVDQRFDPHLQTYAAAAYFRDLMALFDGNLEAALASYNYGEGRIQEALAQPGIRSFWDMGVYGDDAAATIPQETYDYVERFFAVAVIYQNLRAHGFRQPAAADDPFVLIEIDGPLELGRIAADLGLEVETLRVMNPSLVSGWTDEEMPTTLRLPPAPPEDIIDELRRAGHYRISCIYRHKVTDYESLRAIALEYGALPARVRAANALRPGQNPPRGFLVEIPSSLSNRKAHRASKRNLEWWRKKYSLRPHAGALAPSPPRPQGN